MNNSRWVLLEHRGCPSDQRGIHFDLLLEYENGCRTWRLSNILILDGPFQEAIPLPSHSLEWLETSGRAVSGGRGWARPVMGGFFNGELPVMQDGAIKVELHARDISGILEINDCLCRFSSLENFNSN